MQREQRAAAQASDGDDRYNGGVSVSGNSYGYAQQQVRRDPRVDPPETQLHVPRTPISSPTLISTRYRMTSDSLFLVFAKQQQGYYYQDARQQGQSSHQYSESGGYPNQQAYQQQLAYAGMQQSASQPYWYSAPYGEGANGNGSQANAQEGGVQVRDRDVKTQRRKEANRESARRSKQRKKEESELLSSKAQELVRESTSLRAELEKVQKQADKLYKENLELRNQVTKAGGSLPPSLPPVVPVKLPPPIELPLSLFKEIMGSSPAIKKETAPASKASGAGGKDESKEEREKKRQKTGAVKQTGAGAPSNVRSHDQGGIDLPGLLENELNAGEANAEQFVQLSAPAYDGNGNSGGGMLMSDAIVSFREPERDALFPNNTSLDELEMMGGDLRGGAYPINGKNGATADEDEEFNVIRRTELGQGG